MITALAASADRSPAPGPLDFELPEDRIAQFPAEQREEARLLRLDRAAGQWSHRSIADLPQILRRGDLLVVNDTRVIAARLRATVPTGGAAELLLIRPMTALPSLDPAARTQTADWLCLGKPRKRLGAGARLQIGGSWQATIVGEAGRGRYQVRLEGDGPVSELLEQYGEIPLPPYIRRPGGPTQEDLHRYQTVFADRPGAIAAPTAGLHFTPELLARLDAAGVERTAVTLHVGPGTFLPIRDSAASHVMDPEWYEIPAAAAEAIGKARREGRRVIAIGTTTTRALESAARGTGEVPAGSGWADLFIVPGHRFQAIDALFTNFHLPGSTLLLLVSALAGADLIGAAYRAAIADGYRFYSYGDAMLIE